MRQASKRVPDSAEKTVRDIRRATRRHHSAEEKIRIVLEGLRGEDSIAELCRKEGINQNLYYRWSKEFLEAGKKRLAGDTAREATSDEVKELKAEARQLKETLAEVLIENRLLKKAFSGMGRTLHEVLSIRKVTVNVAFRKAGSSLHCSAISTSPRLTACGATCCVLGNERASVGRDGVGSGCTKPCDCSMVTEFADRCRKSPRQDRSHKPWGEANRRAQCGKSACCVRRGGGWKRGTVEMV